MTRVFGVVLLYVSIFLTLLGTVVGTCTMGSADEFLSGCVAGSVGYAAAIGILIARPPRRREWMLLVPAIGALGYQFYWAAGFFIAYRLQGTSACGWKEHNATFEMDGREPLMTAWWLGMAILCLAGLLLAWLRSQGSSARAPKAGK